MKFKKLLIAGIAVLGLASASGVSANASSYFSRDISEAEGSSTKYARRSMDLERLSHGSVFAYIHQTGHKWIHRGEAIKVAPFYHMGHDGFIVHIPGNSGIYYAPTNSYRWYNVKKYRWVKRTKKYVTYKMRFKRITPRFKRSNNKNDLENGAYLAYSPYTHIVYSGLDPTNKNAIVPKNIKLTRWINEGNQKHYKYYFYSKKAHHWLTRNDKPEYKYKHYYVKKYY